MSNVKEFQNIARSIRVNSIRPNTTIVSIGEARSGIYPECSKFYKRIIKNVKNETEQARGCSNETRQKNTPAR